MCGIGGYFGEGNENELRRINEALAHRGPDGAGMWEGKNVGLAHRRLAIIDLSGAAAQPMHRGSLSIAFNGEIYNYQALKKELEASGAAFATQSDTEVILALFEKVGEEAFARLEGMFAIALYDGAYDTLYLARDRFGEKPLYYVRHGNTLVFGSEPKALFVQGGVTPAVRKEGLVAYLSYDVPVSPLSLFQGIAKVPPATYVVCERTGVQEHHYWHPTFEPRHRSEKDALVQLDELLEASVQKQLVSDVPLGVFLSGGIDSSLIAAYAKKVAGEVHTFSVGFAEQSYDESSHARAVAQHLGTMHHEHILTAQDIQNSLHTLAVSLDEPISDPAILPLHLLSKFARERITVALSGDGSDELFLGYPTFFAEQLLENYRHLPSIAKRAIETVVEKLPVSHHYMSLDFKARQFLRGAGEHSAHVHHAWLTAFSDAEISELLGPAYREAVTSVAKRDEELFAEAAAAPVPTQASWWYVRSLLELYLTKADRASMYASLETRAPFLDRAVAEFALTLPTELKLKRGMALKTLQKQLNHHA